MKASELIEKLEEKIKEFGDLDVYGMCEGNYVHGIFMEEHWETQKREFTLE